MPSHSSHQQSGEQPLREPRNAVEHARLYDWLAKDHDLQRALFAFAPITITKPFEILQHKEKRGYLHLELRTTEPDSAGHYYSLRWHTWTGESDAEKIPVFVVARSQQKSARTISDASEYFARVPEDLVAEIRALRRSEDPNIRPEFRNLFGFTDIWPSSEAPQPYTAWASGASRRDLCEVLDSRYISLKHRTLAHRFLAALHEPFDPTVQTLTSVATAAGDGNGRSVIGRRGLLGFPTIPSSTEHAETLKASLAGLGPSDSSKVTPLIRAARNISVGCVSELFEQAVMKFGGAPELKDWAKELREVCPHTHSGATLSLAVKLDESTGAIEPLLSALTRTPLGVSEVRRIATLIQSQRPTIVETLLKTVTEHEKNCAELRVNPVVVSVRHPKRAASYLSLAAVATCGAALFGVKEHNRPILEAVTTVSRAYDSHTTYLEEIQLPPNINALLEEKQGVLKNSLALPANASAKELIASSASITESLRDRTSWILLFTAREQLKKELNSDLAHLQNLTEPLFQDAAIDPLRSKIQALERKLEQDQEKLLVLVGLDSKLTLHLEKMQTMINQKALSVQEELNRAVEEHRRQIDTLAGALRSAPFRSQEEINELMNLKSVKEITRRPLGGVQHSVLAPTGGFRKDLPEAQLRQEKTFLEELKEKIDTWHQRPVQTPPIPTQTIDDFQEISRLYGINTEVSFRASLPIVDSQVYLKLIESLNAIQSLSEQRNVIEARLGEEQQRLQRFREIAQQALELVNRDLNRAGRLR